MLVESPMSKLFESFQKKNFCKIFPHLFLQDFSPPIFFLCVNKHMCKKILRKRTYLLIYSISILCAKEDFLVYLYFASPLHLWGW